MFNDTSTVNANIGSQWVSATDFANALVKARNEALEEAARVADSKVKNAEDWDSSYWDQCAMRIAAAIRALKDRGDG